MKNVKNTLLSVSLGLCLGIVGANAEESNADSNALTEHFKNNYSYFAQIGAQYTQGYYGGKNNFQSLYAYLGFEGVEFERLRFGLNLMGSVKLGRNGAIYGTDIGANALLYQGFIGYTSEYFDLSGGREELDLEWVNDYVEGARFALKIPQGATEIKGYWFYRQAVADYNEVVQFEDNKIGHTFIAGIENSSWEPLTIEAYFVNINSRNADIQSLNGAWLGLNLNLGNDIVASSTSLKYSYFHSKLANFVDTQFLQVDESLDFAVADEHQINATLGITKVLNKKDAVLGFNALGDQNPFEQGEQLYLSNALTAYLGLGYGFADYLEIAFMYGNTSGAKDSKSGKSFKPINEINLGITGRYAGLELGFIYSFNDNDSSNTKLNQDYFEAFVSYNF